MNLRHVHSRHLQRGDIAQTAERSRADVVVEDAHLGVTCAEHVGHCRSAGARGHVAMHAVPLVIAETPGVVNTTETRGRSRFVKGVVAGDADV